MSTSAAGPRYMGVKDASAIVGVHSDKIRSSIASGDLVAYKIGRQYRISLTDLDRWIESNRVEPSAGFTRTIYSSPTQDYRW